MDPQITLRDILEAVEDSDRPTVIAACLNLAEWLDKDGAMPKPMARQVIGPHRTRWVAVEGNPLK